MNWGKDVSSCWPLVGFIGCHLFANDHSLGLTPTTNHAGVVNPGLTLDEERYIQHSSWTPRCKWKRLHFYNYIYTCYFLMLDLWSGCPVKVYNHVCFVLASWFAFHDNRGKPWNPNPLSARPPNPPAHRRQQRPSEHAEPCCRSLLTGENLWETMDQYLYIPFLGGYSHP